MSDYWAVSAHGELLHTFSHRDLAIRWVRERAATHLGLKVKAITGAYARTVYSEPAPSEASTVTPFRRTAR